MATNVGDDVDSVGVMHDPSTIQPKPQVRMMMTRKMTVVLTMSTVKKQMSTSLYRTTMMLSNSGDGDENEYGDYRDDDEDEDHAQGQDHC